LEADLEGRPPGRTCCRGQEMGGVKKDLPKRKTLCNSKKREKVYVRSPAKENFSMGRGEVNRQEWVLKRTGEKKKGGLNQGKPF